MMQRWGYTRGYRQPSRFEEQYHCFSAACADRNHLEGGDKILLPPSAFDTLARLNVDYPMLFQLQSSEKGTLTHCGVLEFTAEEGSIYIPFWMMQNLLIMEGSLITVTNVSLPKANFVKLQPQHVDFLNITNPRAVLEHALRNFSCVTKGDVICIPYNKKKYYFELKEVKPKDAACIIETDCNVDFDAPVGYKEPVRKINNGNEKSEGKINDEKKEEEAEEDTKPKGIQIVDGKIVRPDETPIKQLDESIIAKQVGQTGVQQNTNIPVVAPEADYWALQAGAAAQRLDGKTPAVLKDSSGTVMDIAKIRAEAAEKRQKQLQEERDRAFTMAKNSSGDATKIGTAMASKRKSRVGSKYSQRKGAGSRSAFGGQGNSF